MLLWIIFAVMTAAAALAVVWPLAHKPRAAAGGSDLVVYQDQLEEIERDRNAGLIGEPEAQAARVEVSRRLLAAADVHALPPPPPLWHRRVAALVAVGVLCSLPIVLYAVLGSPGIPDQPAYARLALPSDHDSIAALVGQVEQRLAQNPNDGAGWQVIAPVYMRMGRIDDAVAAFRKSLALNGETATRDSDLGEALVAAANGVVTVEAKKLFERAAALESNNAKARYFLGLADEQDGNREAAVAKWRALLQSAPANAPWAEFVRQSLARVDGQPVTGPGPSAQDVAAAANMPEAQRAQMIRAMVAKLSDQLHANGANVDGWLRLVRAYVVLGDEDKAKAAAGEAKRALAERPDDLKRIDDLVRTLGLQG